MKKSQYDLQKEIQAIGINVVTCGHCASTILHESSDTEITCTNCGLTEEPCHFPDLNYQDEEDSRLQEPLSHLTKYPSIIPSELSRAHLASMCAELHIAKNHGSKFVVINLNGVRYSQPVSRLKDYQKEVRPMTGGTKI